MATLEARCLDAFPNWLGSLPSDARALAALLERGADAEVERSCCASLNYLFKSLDLIPDGLEDLGFIDDAFVIRAAAEALRQHLEPLASVDPTGTLARLAEEAELVREFLGTEFARLTKYVTGLEQSSARGRTVSAILADAATRADFVGEVGEWADGYMVPTFARDARNLVKLRAFMLAKLPA